jgi:WD40 repeat protein
MRHRSLLSMLAVTAVAVVTPAITAEASAPTVVWSAPNPGGLAGSVGAVAWSPDGTLVASGLSERNLRIRRASDGQLLTTILQPIRSRGVIRTLFSRDGQFLAVGNAAGTTQFRVYRVSTWAFLGLLMATLDANSIIHYAPDATLAGAAGGPGQLSKWDLSELPVFFSSGSGYDRVVTRFALSPNGLLESAQSKGTVTVRRVSGGAVLTVVPGDSSAFSSSSATLAAWTASPNHTKVYRTADFSLVRTLVSPDPMDGGIALRFTPSGSTLLASGYLPFLNPDGSWNQKGIIRFWRVADGALLNTYDQSTSLGVTSGVAFSPDAKKLVFGVYDGTTVAALNPY